MSWSKAEFESKLKRVHTFMAERDIDNLVISEPVNFLWLTGGRPYVNMMSSSACASILIKHHKVYLLSNNIEAQRLKVEELSELPVS